LEVFSCGGRAKIEFREENGAKKETSGDDFTKKEAIDASFFSCV